VQVFRDQNGTVRTEKTMRDAIDEFIAARQAANRRKSYTDGMRVILDNFAMSRETRNVSEITRDELKQWLDSNNWEPWTRITYRARLETFFTWCVLQGYRGANPVLAIEVPRADEQPVAFLTVPQPRRLLMACRQADPGMIPYFSLCLFAGLRPDEAKAMTWDNVREDGIEVFATKKRSRRRRIVEAHPTLGLWLKLGGKLPVRNFKHRFNAVRAYANQPWTEGEQVQPLKWIKDVMRHTFCTYAYLLLGPAKTAMSAGHKEQVLFQHYRGLATKAQAEQFWALTPADVLPVEGPSLPAA
jgi:integrase